MTLAEYLRETGLSQQEFARRVGISQPTVSALLAGRRKPSLALMEKITRATNGLIPVGSFLTAQENEDG